MKKATTLYSRYIFPRLCRYCRAFTNQKVAHEVTTICYEHGESKSFLESREVFPAHADCHSKKCADKECKEWRTRPFAGVRFSCIAIVSALAFFMTASYVSAAPTDNPFDLAQDKPNLRDTRDPQIVYVEGVMKGTYENTVPTMMRMSKSMLELFRERVDVEGLERFTACMKEMQAMIAAAADIVEDPAFAETMTFEHPKMKSFVAARTRATDAFFGAIERVNHPK